MMECMRAVSVAVAVVFASPALADGPITLQDFNTLVLGATIVGPVGPEVEASLIGPDGASVGDINSRVQCPDGVETCAPPKLPAGTVYTYIHEITPGADRPNDTPFARPDQVVSMDGANLFRLGRKSEGFTGVAGYSFSEAKAATGTEQPFTISADADGRLVWRASDAHPWKTGQTVTFFWQTTQPPVGPRDGFTLSNGQMSGTGIGPAPKPAE
tara:strand:+ start:111 stop:752 length:642 start_codon:yes stop_codon:yes gene_type:complete